MLGQSITSERSSVSPILHIHADIADNMGGIHRPNLSKNLCANVGKALDDSFVTTMYFHADVFSDKCGIEKGDVVAVEAYDGSVHGISDGFPWGEGGEGKWVRHFLQNCEKI